ncbi:MAG: tRNA guanosine(34) transglycosylase Tgt [Planctomycetes bacterium GWF2_41_51]|nr:MAG: tRNA guanosine(34) transglycosylase Tgt [Planctomycetes bacterium GWF2_41_51]HBG27289.1 tRNA guanosine(34) transglycosylase Tgt [Phycisphaerales bacterium]
MKIFEILKKDPKSNARTAILETFHGKIRTPVFMPVGTRATVKGLLPKDLHEAGSQIILGNTFHLMLRPGADVIQKIGGLHKFMAWDKPILTDSGGFQVFSLSEINSITDDGTEFYSPYDGAKIKLDAARATAIQNQLGADIIMCFDQCPAYNAPQKEQEKAVERTLCWAKVCKKSHANDRQLLFGIVQGQTDNNLRQNCAEELIKMDFPGYALGGLSVGEGTAQMLSTVRFAAPLLPENKPRYLMGVGTPVDLIQAVEAGIDMFDCVMPTRNGRNSLAFTSQGVMRLRNAAYIDDPKPLDSQCLCYCCKTFTRSAIRHYFNVGEMLGPILLSLHNIVFYHNLMDKIRENIENGTFANWAAQALQSPAYARSQITDDNDTK